MKTDAYGSGDFVYPQVRVPEQVAGIVDTQRLEIVHGGFAPHVPAEEPPKMVDIANVVFLSWFSNPHKRVETILDEYASFYFGHEATTIREQLEWLDDSNRDPQRAEKILAAVTTLDAMLPEWAKDDWRWAEIRESCGRFKTPASDERRPLTCSDDT